MTWIGIAQIAVFFLIVLAITKPLGTFMYRVFEGERTFLHPIFRPVERLIYRLERGPRKRGAVVGRVFRVHDFAKHLQLSGGVFAPALAGPFALQPHAVFDAQGSFVCHADDARFGLQHGGQLHDQHQLAVLLSRHDA